MPHSDQEVALLRDELRRSHDALAVSQKHLGVLASHLHTLTSASSPPSVDPRTSHSSILSNCLTDAPVPLSQVKGLVGDHTPLAVPPLAFLLSQQQLSRRSAPSTRLPSAPSLASSPPQAAPTASSASHVAPSLASYQPPSVRSLKSSSRSRDRLSREPNPLKQMAHVLQRLVRPEEAEREAVRLGAVLLIQAVARGAAARRELRLRRAVNAHVHEATILTKPSRYWGVVSIPCYAITVIRDSSTWTVHHRYSDWRDLHALLRPLLPSLPPLPPKRPFRSARVTRQRQEALDAYLQRVLPLAAASPAARRLLLDFLSKSHQSWKYDTVPPPADVRRPAVYDRSSGATASSVVGRRTAPPPAAARRLASAREARAPTRAALERQGAPLPETRSLLPSPTTSSPLASTNRASPHITPCLPFLMLLTLCCLSSVQQLLLQSCGANASTRSTRMRSPTDTSRIGDLPPSLTSPHRGRLALPPHEEMPLPSLFAALVGKVFHVLSNVPGPSLCTCK
ncbi:hypothetical protein AB1Y20_012197 [Prymnesium parvum]|uniref:PX domain-containing protein n=1 Tax=Prymnesium parvum TaxID=97485 RepID=A0AB34IRC6_PRYPA